MENENVKPHPEIAQISLGFLLYVWWAAPLQNTGSGHDEISRLVEGTAILELHLVEGVLWSKRPGSEMSVVCRLERPCAL